MKNTKQIIVAGPCAAESLEQIEVSALEARARGVDFMRVNLWKPRTKPGFDGLGAAGLSLLTEVAKHGVNPGLEVIVPEHVSMAMEAVLPVSETSELLVWIGARNQNHLVQQEIARVASRDKRVKLLVKNQPWRNETHWEGIVEHVLAGGIAAENLILCDRGFAPVGENPAGYRNIPDYAMAMRIRDKYGLPMVFDPSHTGGSVENVYRILEEAAEHVYDGMIIEVHPDPKNALTDKNQQVTWGEFDEIVELVSRKRESLLSSSSSSSL